VKTWRKGKQGRRRREREKGVKQLLCGKKRKRIKKSSEGRNVTLLLLVKIRKNSRSFA